MIWGGLGQKRGKNSTATHAGYIFGDPHTPPVLLCFGLHYAPLRISNGIALSWKLHIMGLPFGHFMPLSIHNGIHHRNRLTCLLAMLGCSEYSMDKSITKLSVCHILYKLIYIALHDICIFAKPLTHSVYFGCDNQLFCNF